MVMIKQNPVLPGQSDRLNWYIRAHLKIRHLEVLVALDDLRGLNRVAEYLHVTQPAVSKILTAMEQGMAAILFKRTAKGLVPTEVGACMIKYARSVLEQLRMAQNQVRDIQDGHTLRVSIGALPWAAVVVMPRFIACLEETTPQVSVSVSEGTQDTLLTSLRTGDLDFAVGVLPDKPLGIEFASELLIDDLIVVAVRRNHPLEQQPDLNWDAVGKYPMVLPPPATYVRGAIDGFFAKHQIALPSSRVQSLSTMTNVGTLQMTDSVGLLSSLVASHFADLDVLSVLPLDIPEIRIPMGLIWRADQRDSKANDMVRQVFTEVRENAFGPV